MKKILLTVITVVLASLAMSAQDGSDMYRKGKGLYIAGESLSADQVLNLIGDENYYETYVGAQKQYKSGKNLVISGSCVAAAGIAACAIGMAGLDNTTYVCGICLNLIGSGLLDAGIPLLCIGKARLQWCADDYNRNASGHRNTAVSLDFGAQKYGTGIALRF